MAAFPCLCLSWCIGEFPSESEAQVHVRCVCVCVTPSLHPSTPCPSMCFLNFLWISLNKKYIFDLCFFPLLSGTSAVHVPHYVTVGLALVPSIICEVALSVRLCQQRRVKDNPQQRTNPQSRLPDRLKKKDKN